VRVYGSGTTAQAVDVAAFVVDPAGGSLTFAPWALPQPLRSAAGIELDVTCGYGGAATDVPEPLRQAIRLIVAQWYEHRGVAEPGANAVPLPLTVPALIAPYRVVSL
jgi:uncharacterized phiE125 gp8 family phage protein